MPSKGQMCTKCSREMYPNFRGTGANKELVLMCVKRHEEQLLCDHGKILKERTKHNTNRKFWSCFISFNEKPKEKCGWENSMGQTIWYWEDDIKQTLKIAEDAENVGRETAQPTRNSKHKCKKWY